MPQSEKSVTRRGFLAQTGKGALLVGVTAASAAAAVASTAEPLAPPDKEPPNLPIPGPPGRKVGFAVVGLGELAVEQILPAFALCQHAVPVALVSGHRDKAAKIADHYGIDPKKIYDYGNYEDLRNDPAVEVIYIVLPNSMHPEFTIRGFAAGKHILCEKPMCVTVDDAEKMIAAGKAANKKLMIAYRLRYEPYNQKAIELMRNGTFGPVQVFTAENLQTTRAPNIRLSTKTGGGPLGDVGVYCINAARYITGEEPVAASGMQFADPKLEQFREVPQTVVCTLRFPSGAIAQCSAGFNSTRSERFRVSGTRGWLQLDPAFGYVGQRLKTSDGDSETELTLPHVNHFAKEMDHFAECVLNDTAPLTPGEEGLRDMRVVEAVKKSIAEGREVTL